MTIEFVYFDLGNVLVSFDPERACRNIATLFDVSTDQARQVLYESGLETAYERGEWSDDAFADQLRKAVNATRQSASTQAILDAMADMFDPIESMAPLVSQTRAKVGQIGVLSNTCRAHWQWVRRQGWEVSQLEFDCEILSFEVGSMKPDPLIYEAAQQAADVPPECILFLDDRAENINAARSHGWQAVTVRDVESSCQAIDQWLG